MPFQLTRKDLIGGLLLLVFCFFSFQHGDLMHTASCSVSYLRGHWSDFYEWNEKLHGLPNYLPSTYLVYAIWGLPLELLGLIGEQPIFNHPGWGPHFLLWYYKLLGILFLGLSTWMVVKISRFAKTGDDDTSAAVSFFTHPIIIYSALCFGQYDIITAFFVLSGYYFYLQRRLLLFGALFGLAITFKTFPMFLFVPMLLLAEKRFVRWIVPGILLVLPTAIERLAYHHSPAFHSGTTGFGFERTYAAKLSYEVSQFSILFAGWTLICLAAWWTRLRDEVAARFRWSSYYMAAAMAWAFVWFYWHPQWMLHVAVLVSLATLGLKDRARVWWMDLVWMGAYVLVVAKLFSFNADTILMALGAWNWWFPKAEFKDIAGFFFVKNFPLEIALAAFNAVLVSYLFTLHPAVERNWGSWFGTQSAMDPKKVLWWRFAGGVLIFVVLAGIRFIASPHA